MDGFHGADIQQLRDLARSLEAGGRALAEVRVALSAQISGGSYWKGPDFQQFRAAWDSGLSAQLTAAANTLAAAARAAERNAAQQEAASTDTGLGPAAGGGPTTGGGQRTSSEGEVIRELFNVGRSAIGLIGLGGDLINYVRHADVLVGRFGTALAGAGVGFALVDIVEGVAQDDHLKATYGAANLVVGGLTVMAIASGPTPVGAALGATALGLGVAVTVSDFFLPTSKEDLAEGESFAARQMFGSGATLDNLTPQQQAQLDQRYSGLGGLGMRVADEVGGNVEKVSSAASSAVKDFIGWMW